MNDALTLAKINITTLLKEKITYVLLLMYFFFIFFTPNTGHFLSFFLFYSFINTHSKHQNFISKTSYKLPLTLPIKRNSIILEYYLTAIFFNFITLFYLILTNILAFPEFSLLNLTLFYMTILLITASAIIPVMIKKKDKNNLLLELIILLPFALAVSIPNLDATWFLNFINNTNSIIFIIVLLISTITSLYISYNISKKLFKTYEILN